MRLQLLTWKSLKQRSKLGTFPSGRTEGRFDEARDADCRAALGVEGFLLAFVSTTSPSSATVKKGSSPRDA